MSRLAQVLAALVLFLSALPLLGQGGRSLDLTVNDVGLSIGDSPRVIGLRLNYRDRQLEEVSGVNATIWSPFKDTGHVRGLALGLPMTGARRIDGFAVGLAGIEASEAMHGIAIGGIGAGSGGDINGIAIGGIGLGAGGHLRGVAIGGIGTGAGGNVRGIAIGGLGVGAGGHAEGLLIGGLGVGAGGNVRGVLLAAGGVGAGGSLTGLKIAGLGLGAGGNVTGVQIAGIGMGAGGALQGISIAGVGLGAVTIEGLAVAPAMGAQDIRGVVIAPAYLRVENGGTMTGLSVSAFNRIQGTQRGLAIGLLNIADRLDGVQIGLLNIARNKSPGTRVLPLVNFARDR